MLMLQQNRQKGIKHVSAQLQAARQHVKDFVQQKRHALAVDAALEEPEVQGTAISKLPSAAARAARDTHDQQVSCTHLTFTLISMLFFWLGLIG